MAAVPSKTTKTKVVPVERVVYYVRVGNEDVVTIDRLPTDTLAEARDEIAEEVGGFRYLRNGIPVSRRSEKRVRLRDALTNDKLVVKLDRAEAHGEASEGPGR